MYRGFARFTLPAVGLRETEGMVYLGMVYLDAACLVLRVKTALLGVLDTKKDLEALMEAFQALR